MGGPGSLGIFELERGLRRWAGSPQVSAATARRLPRAQGQTKPERLSISRICDGPPCRGRVAQG
jgi:hypothetical protein